MTWDELFTKWSALEAARRRQDAQAFLRDARKRVGHNDEADWQWLADGLADPREYFIADVFRFQPVPKRLFAAFMRAAVLDVNYSNNRGFLAPCVESFGRDAVQAELDRLRDSGVATADMHDAGMYWMGQGSSHRRSGMRSEGGPESDSRDVARRQAAARQAPARGTSVDLAALESKLGVRFPPRHTEALRNTEDPIHRACDFLLAESQYGLLRLADVHDFLHRPDAVDQWPPFLVAFASNGCGDCFAYDLRRGMRVVYIDPDRTVAENLSAEDEFEFETFDAWYEWASRKRKP